MDFKLRFYILMISISIIIASCNSSEDKIKPVATYYIELANFNGDSVKLIDSLKKTISEKLFWKASYYKAGNLQIVPITYLTGNDSAMHFYKDINELGDKIEEGTRKIRVEFGGKYTSDSISFRLQKFTLTSSHWRKTSDMGFIKATNTYSRTKEYAIDQYVKYILNNVVLYSYN